MITALTEAQRARFPEFVEKWIRIGLCTDPADRPKAEQAIVEMYEVAGLSPPAKIVWCGSPLGSALTRAIILSGGDSVRNSVRKSVWDSVRIGIRDSFGNSVEKSVSESVWNSVWNSIWISVRHSVWDSVWFSVRESVRISIRNSVGNSGWDSIENSVGDRVWSSVWNSVWNSVGASVWNSVGASVWNSVWNSVGDSAWISVRNSVEKSIGHSVEKSVGDSVLDSIYGQHEAPWLGFYDYFRTVCGLHDQTAQLSGMWNLAETAGWILPHAAICWVSERHNTIKQDDAGRLHCMDGPAITYPDGWAIYAVHGTLVPSAWFERREALTPAKALNQTNVELRRAACELLGWNHVISDLNARTLDRDSDPTIGELLEVNHPQIGKEKFLRVLCPTGREFCLPVPPHVETALQANAWTWGLDHNQYKPEVQT